MQCRWVCMSANQLTISNAVWPSQSVNFNSTLNSLHPFCHLIATLSFSDIMGSYAFKLSVPARSCTIICSCNTVCLVLDWLMSNCASSRKNKQKTQHVALCSILFFILFYNLYLTGRATEGKLFYKGTLIIYAKLNNAHWNALYQGS